MRTGSKPEPLDHAFMGSLVGWVASVFLDACRFVMSHGAGRSPRGGMGSRRGKDASGAFG